MARSGGPLHAGKRHLAIKSGSIIAVICATSWTLLACAIMVPYLGLLALRPKAGPQAALASSLGASSAR